MKAHRMELPPVREVNLNGCGPRPDGLRLSAWRGASGHRYIVLIQPIDRVRPTAEPGSVMIGVRRGADGVARIVGVGHRGSITDAVVLARLDRANEIHVHTLAETDEERDAIVDDLVGDDAI
jgi:hypothetical protein